MANLFSEKPIVEIVAVPGRDGTDIPIDDRLSDTSENPVQNKVVKQAIDNAVSATEDYATQAVEQAYEQLDEAKQDVLDDSGAGQNIKTINGESILGTGNLEVGSQIDVDDALNPTSENPVQNRTLYNAFNELNSTVTDTVYRLANREYGYTHEAIVTDDLENDYNLIINGGYQRLYNPPIDWATKYASYYYLDDTIYRLNTSPTWDWSVEYYKRYTPNSDLANVSAVGMLAVLNHGVYTAVPTQPADWEVNYDKYFYLTSEGYIFNEDSTWNPNRSYYSYSGDVVRTQENRLFINGEESNGYTFRGANSQNGIELVKIWWFESDGSLVLDIPEVYSIDNLSVKKMNVEPVINNISSVYTFREVFENTSMSSSNYNSETKILEYNRSLGRSGTLQGFIPQNIVEFRSNHTNINTTNSSAGYSPFFVNGGTRTNLKRIKMPELISISASSPSGRSGFNGCVSLEIHKEDIPMLKTIDSMNEHFGAFGGVNVVELPETVEIVGSYSFSGVGVSTVTFGIRNKKIILYCREADFKPNWCTLSASEYFEMCYHWATSIDISKAASTVWDTDAPYLDLINNRLDDVGFVTAPSNNGNADYDSVTGTYTPNTTGTGAYNTAHYITVPTARLAVLPQEATDAAFNKGFEIRGA